MKVKTKLLAALVILFLFTVFVFFEHHWMEKSRLSLLIQSQLEEESAVFDKLVELKGKSLREIATDYTTWDEMAQFLRSADPVWAGENLDNALTTFSVDTLWVYRADGSLCYRTPDPGGSDFSVADVLKVPMSQLFARGPAVHFFARTPEGIAEIRGSTIHPSADLKRQSAPLGYFFVGRAWTDSVTGDLSRLIDGRVNLIGPRSALSRPAFDFKTGRMIFFKSLKDQTARPVATVRVELPFRAYFATQQLSNRFLKIICLIAPLFFALFYLLLSRWIQRPLRQIVRALNEDRTDVLEGLRSAPDEFGDVARLIIRFAEQKRQLSQEVSERRQTEERLKISQKRFRDIVDNAMEWIWEVDAEGRFTYVSPAMVRTLGYALQEIIGRNFYEFFHPENLERQKKDVADLLTRQQPFGQLESRCRRKDGTDAWILTAAVPIVSEKGEFAGYRGFVTDITQLKSTQQSLTQKLQELEKMNRFMVDRELRMAELKSKLKTYEPNPPKPS